MARFILNKFQLCRLSRRLHDRGVNYHEFYIQIYIIILQINTNLQLPDKINRDNFNPSLYSISTVSDCACAIKLCFLLIY